MSANHLSFCFFPSPIAWKSMPFWFCFPTRPADPKGLGLRARLSQLGHSRKDSVRVGRAETLYRWLRTRLARAILSSKPHEPPKALHNEASQPNKEHTRPC